MGGLIALERPSNLPSEAHALSTGEQKIKQPL